MQSNRLASPNPKAIEHTQTRLQPECTDCSLVKADTCTQSNILPPSYMDAEGRAGRWALPTTRTPVGLPGCTWHSNSQVLCLTWVNYWMPPLGC